MERAAMVTYLEVNQNPPRTYRIRTIHCSRWARAHSFLLWLIYLSSQTQPVVKLPLFVFADDSTKQLRDDVSAILTRTPFPARVCRQPKSNLRDIFSRRRRVSDVHATLPLFAVTIINAINRPIWPADLEVLKEMHAALFPIRYESEFFFSVVNRHGIVSWAAVDRSRSDGRNDEIIGFVIARLVVPTETEVGDILGYCFSRTSQSLMYILTLGVVEQYRHLGIASALVQEVIKYTASIHDCKAVYLHVITYNEPAILFYQKMNFQCIRRLPKFYYIKRQHFDAYLYAYYVNGGRSPCSAIVLVTAVATYIRSFFTSLATRLWKHNEKAPRWPRCKESSSLFFNANRTIHGSDNGECQYV